MPGLALCSFSFTSDQKFCVYITERTLNCWSHGNQMNFNWWLLGSHQKAHPVHFCFYFQQEVCLLVQVSSCLFSLLNEPGSVFWLLVSKVFCCLCHLRTLPAWHRVTLKSRWESLCSLLSRHIWENWPEPGLSVHEPDSPLRDSRDRNHSPSQSISILSTHFGQTSFVGVNHRQQHNCNCNCNHRSNSDFREYFIQV